MKENMHFSMLQSTKKHHLGRKLLTVSLVSGSLLMLSACGVKKGAEIKVSSGSYVQEYDGASARKGQGYLALKVNVKNTTGQKLELSSSDFKLKKGDKTLSPESLSIDGINNIDYQTLDKDDSASGYIYFKVNKKDKYQLRFNPQATDSDKDDKLKSTSTDINADKYKDPGQSAKKAAEQYVKAVFLNEKNAQNHNDLSNNVKEDAKTFHDDFVKGFRDIDEDNITDQQADTIFQSYVSDGQKRDQISYKVTEAGPDEVTIEVVAKTVDISDIDTSQMLSDFEKDFENKHQDDDEVDYDEVEKEAYQYLVDKLPDLISKSDLSTADSSGYQLKLKKKDGKWEVVTTGSDSSGYTELKDQFLAGVASAY